MHERSACHEWMYVHVLKEVNKRNDWLDAAVSRMLLYMLQTMSATLYSVVRPFLSFRFSACCVTIRNQDTCDTGDRGE